MEQTADPHGEHKHSEAQVNAGPGLLAGADKRSSTNDTETVRIRAPAGSLEMGRSHSSTASSAVDLDVSSTHIREMIRIHDLWKGLLINR